MARVGSSTLSSFGSFLLPSRLSLPLFSSLFQQSEYTTLKLTAHYTRAPTKRSSVFETIEAVPWATAIAHHSPTLVPGRPNFQNVFNSAIDGAISLWSGGTGMSVSGMAIGIRGSVGFDEAVVRPVGEIDAEARC